MRESDWEFYSGDRLSSAGTYTDTGSALVLTRTFPPEEAGVSQHTYTKAGNKITIHDNISLSGSIVPVFSGVWTVVK